MRYLLAQEGFTFDSAYGVVDDIESEKGIPDRVFRRRLAGVLGDYLTSSSIYGVAPDRVIETAKDTAQPCEGRNVISQSGHCNSHCS